MALQKASSEQAAQRPEPREARPPYLVSYVTNGTKVLTANPRRTAKVFGLLLLLCVFCWLWGYSSGSAVIGAL